MSTKSFKFGLVNMLLGAVSLDGGAGVDLEAVGNTVADSAKMDTTEANTQDFNIEEADSPVLTVKTAADKIVVSWSTYDYNADMLVKLFGGTKVVAGVGSVQSAGTITAGTGYTASGTYLDVPVTGGAGTGLRADVTVSGGGITAVVIRNGGKDYVASTSGLTVSNANLGGAGSGFSFVGGPVAAFGESWAAPDQIPDIEQTLKVDMKLGGHVLIPRAKISAKLSMGYKKTALSQIDITATVLQPDKAGVARLYMVDAVAS